jgi:hypothetical protein
MGPSVFPADVLIEKLSNIRTMILGAPLYSAFRSLTPGAPGVAPCMIPYRGMDIMYARMHRLIDSRVPALGVSIHCARILGPAATVPQCG